MEPNQSDPKNSSPIQPDLNSALATPAQSDPVISVPISQSDPPPAGGSEPQPESSVPVEPSSSPVSTFEPLSSTPTVAENPSASISPEPNQLPTDEQPMPDQTPPTTPTWSPPEQTMTSVAEPPTNPLQSTTPSGFENMNPGAITNPITPTYNPPVAVTVDDLYGPKPDQQPIAEEPPTAKEPAPTDLSHLIGNHSDEETAPVYMPPVAQPETLVVPPNGNISEPNIPTESGSGISKWVIGLGAGLILAVAGASGYFILGIGQPQQTTSLPATQQSAPATVIVNPAPIVTNTPVVATGSSNFGQLNNTSPTPIQATSAADLLRQRQGR